MPNQERDAGFTTAVGLRLKAARLALAKNQTTLAREINAAPNTYSQWESGARLADVMAMANLGNRYGISLDWVFRGIPAALPHNLAGQILEQHTALTRPKAVVKRRANSR